MLRYRSHVSASNAFQSSSVGSTRSSGCSQCLLVNHQTSSTTPMKTKGPMPHLTEGA